MSVASVENFGIARISRRFIAFAAAATLMAFATAHAPQAQVTLDPAAILPGADSICVDGAGQLLVAINDECSTITRDVVSITFGPAATGTVLDDTGLLTVGTGLTVRGGTPIDMGGNQVHNVATPTAATDAANKQYVDAENDLQDTQINQNTANIATNTANIATNTADIVTLQNSLGNAGQAITALQAETDRLDQRDEELAEGIAISLALDSPTLRTGQVFAMRGGWGNFDGTNAAGFSAAGLIAPNIVLDAGVGVGAENSTVAGKGGITVGW